MSQPTYRDLFQALRAIHEDVGEIKRWCERHEQRHLEADRELMRQVREGEKQIREGEKRLTSLETRTSLGSLAAGGVGVLASIVAALLGMKSPT
jgi:hypothetical protein